MKIAVALIIGWTLGGIAAYFKMPLALIVVLGFSSTFFVLNI